MSNSYIRTYLLLALAFAMFTSACTKEGNTSEQAKYNGFFDLEGYMRSVVSRYQVDGISVNKKVDFNSKKEFHEDVQPDWEREFQPIIQADINHSSWAEKFSTDTLPSENGYTVLYTCSSPAIPVRELEIRFDDNKNPENIRIKTSRKNLLYQSGQEVTFIPDKEYAVKGWQRALFLSRTEFTVQSEIITKETE